MKFHSLTKMLTVGLIAVMTAALLVGCGSESSQKKFLNIGTGGTAGTYYPIGGAIAAASGAAFLCYVTPAEHLALPNVDDVKQGIIASRIAAHAADIAKKIPHARDMDDAMADARRTFDWEKQWQCAIDPETAKAIRDSRAPEHEDSCSMCGKFCAVRSMNKALDGEYIDIL